MLDHLLELVLPVSMQYSFRSTFQRNLSRMMILIRNALAYSILDKKQIKKNQLGSISVLFQRVFYSATFYHYREKHCGFLALQDYKVKMLAFIAEDDS